MSKLYLRLHESHIYPFVSLVTLEAIIVFVRGEPLGHHHPGSRAFLSLVRFWRTRKSLCLNRVKSLLSLPCMFLAVLILGLQIAVRPWYGRLGYDQRSITKRMLALEKPVWREKTRLTSPEVHAAVTSKAWRDSGSQETKRRLCLQGGVGHHWYSSTFNGVSTAASSSPKSMFTLGRGKWSVTQKPKWSFQLFLLIQL